MAVGFETTNDEAIDFVVIASVKPDGTPWGSVFDMVSDARTKGEPVLGLGPSVFDSTENAEQSVDGFSPWIVPETNG